MIWAESRPLAKQLERDALIAQIRDVIVDVIPRALDCGVGRLRSIGTAALAGTEAGALRGIRRREESDIIALWSPRWTRWTAIDSRRGDTIAEAIIGGGVSAEHGLPGDSFIHGSLLHWILRSHRGLLYRSSFQYRNHNSRRQYHARGYRLHRDPEVAAGARVQRARWKHTSGQPVAGPVHKR